MSDTLKLTAFRLSAALLKRLDRQAQRVSQQTGNPTSRADVVRTLLARGLDAAEAESTRKKK